jgi:hypothetical protein
MFFYLFLNKALMMFFFLNRFVFLFLIFFKDAFAAIAVLLGAVAANGLVWCCANVVLLRSVCCWALITVMGWCGRELNFSKGKLSTGQMNT